MSGGNVRAFASYAGKLVIGGSFSAAGGVSAANIAAWDGILWSPLGSGLDSSVNALAVFGGELIAGKESPPGGVDPPTGYIANWGPACPRGDMNCDQAVDADDVPAFVSAVLDPSQLSDCAGYLANTLPDVNPDGTPRIDGNDIQPFVNRLLMP
ncbi:MAG: hypothetical protein IT368_05105 [Candidatus Hydrogenedentes bacterium]|nr:hypothetical protein [Candidatus Hydrogenedentota bacterium]